jgi:phage terminase large subunit
MMAKIKEIRMKKSRMVWLRQIVSKNRFSMYQILRRLVKADGLAIRSAGTAQKKR